MSGVVPSLMARLVSALASASARMISGSANFAASQYGVAPIQAALSA
jgi:hypothetical protein